MHVKFQAVVKHDTPVDGIEKVEHLVPSQVAREGQKGAKTHVGSDAPQSSTNFHAVESSNRCNGPDLTDQMTRFLALDKCLPRRNYLSILHLESKVGRDEATLEYDPEWLAIVKKTHGLLQTDRRSVSLPAKLEDVTAEEISWIEERLSSRGGKSIPQNFKATVPLYSHPVFQGKCRALPRMANPQTDYLLDMLGLDHILTIPSAKSPSFEKILFALGQRLPPVDSTVDANEIDIEDAMDGGDDADGPDVGVAHVENVHVADGNEIEIDDLSSNEQDQLVLIADENEIEVESESEGSSKLDQQESLETISNRKKARIDSN